MNRVQIIGIVLIVVAFGATAGASFHFDDYSLFSDPVLRSTSGWWEVFALERTRPLTYLTFLINLQLGGDHPVGFHLVNVLIHLAAAWLAWSIFRRVSEPNAAMIAAVFFALHPIQTEPVAYVFARATLLAALFCLLSWKAWIDRRLWPSAFFFGLALLSKEEAVAFPAFLVGFEVLYHKRAVKELGGKLKVWAVMFGLAALSGARLFYAAHVTEGAGIAFDLGEVTSATYFLTQGRVIWQYLSLLVWPRALNFDWDFRLSQGWDAATLLAWIGLLAVIVASLFLVRRRHEFYWLIGFFILLAPASSVVPLADLIAERRMYLPLLSLSLGIGVLLRRIPWPAVLGLAVVLASLSFQRSLVWRTEESLWRDAAEKSPDKVRPKLQLARALERTGQGTRKEQRELLHEAKALAPEKPVVATELGVFYLKNRRPEQALNEFRHVLASSPHDPQALTNAGAAYYMLGDIDAASQAFRQALASEPCHFDARNNLILLARSRGDREMVRHWASPPRHCRYTTEQRAALAVAAGE